MNKVDKTSIVFTAVALIFAWNTINMENQLCHEVLLQDTIVLDQTATLYFHRDEKWAPRKVPPIFECPQKTMSKLDSTAEGLYINETILISDKSGIFNGDPFAWSVLAHELVHNLQSLDGKMAKVDVGEIRLCELENEAYALQEQFLKDVESKWAVDQSDECLKAKYQ